MKQKTYKLPKVLTLNYRNWRCGGDFGDNVHGKGQTALRNDEGYKCCLGQFCGQAGIPSRQLTGYGQPDDLGFPIVGLTQYHIFGPVSCELSNQAMGINDDEETTIEQKVKKLRSLFKKRGYKIELKNFPKSVLKAVEN